MCREKLDYHSKVLKNVIKFSVFILVERCQSILSSHSACFSILHYGWCDPVYRRTAPNKPSIGKYANFWFCDHFLPLVTLFWQFLMHTSTEPNSIFLKNCIGLNIFSLDFKIRVCQQGHHYSEPTYMPLITTFNLTCKLCAYTLFMNLNFDTFR